MSNRTIPVLDLSKFVDGNEADRQQFVSDIGKAFHTVGFVGIVNHGISKELVDGFYAASKAFFSNPVSVKRNYKVKGAAGQRGYTSFGTEHAKQSEVADLKEFFQLGQYVDADHPKKEQYPDNPFVDVTPEFSTLGKDLYKAFEKSGSQRRMVRHYARRR